MQDVSARAAAVEYEKVLDKYSAGDSEYNGFYHSFGFHAALLNSDVLEANIRRQARFYMWDKTRTEEERDKLFKAASEGTAVFLSFFTPEKKDDNLSTEKSIWRVLLDVGGNCQHSWPLPKALAVLQKNSRSAALLLNCGEDVAALVQHVLPPSNGAAHTARSQSQMDLRTYGIGAQILRELGIAKMKLLGSPRRMPSMIGYGLEVTGFLASEQHQG